MDTKSTDTRESWTTLAERARQAAPPGDLDVSHLVQARIRAEARPAMVESSGGLFDDLLDISRSAALRIGLACLALGAAWCCWQGGGAIREASALWSLEGPLFTRL